MNSGRILTYYFNMCLIAPCLNISATSASNAIQYVQVPYALGLYHVSLIRYGFLPGIQSNITHVDTLCLKSFSVYCINFNEKIQCQWECYIVNTTAGCNRLVIWHIISRKVPDFRWNSQIKCGITPKFIHQNVNLK